jgi:purine catabolism regulator
VVMLVNGHIGTAREVGESINEPLPTGQVRIALHRAPEGSDDHSLERLRLNLSRFGFCATDDDGLSTVVLDASQSRRLVSASHGSSTALGLSEAGSLEDTPALLEQARAALALSAVSRTPVNYDEVAGASVDRSLRHMLAAQQPQISASTLRPLVQYDSDNRGELVRTLQVWLEANGRYEAATQILSIHRHTLRQRMDRIAELLGVDVDDFATRVALWVCLRTLPDAGS